MLIGEGVNLQISPKNENTVIIQRVRAILHAFKCTNLHEYIANEHSDGSVFALWSNKL